jgi:hypothetical protein
VAVDVDDAQFPLAQTEAVDETVEARIGQVMASAEDDGDHPF